MEIFVKEKEKVMYQGMDKEMLIEIIINFKESSLRLLEELADLKSQANKVAIEKLEELKKYYENECCNFRQSTTGKNYFFYDHDKFNTKVYQLIAELKGGSNE